MPSNPDLPLTDAIDKWHKSIDFNYTAIGNVTAFLIAALLVIATSDRTFSLMQQRIISSSAITLLVQSGLWLYLIRRNRINKYDNVELVRSENEGNKRGALDTLLRMYNRDKSNTKLEVLLDIATALSLGQVLLLVVLYTYKI